MSATITCNVHTNEDTIIACDTLTSTNTVKVGGVTIFAQPSELYRLADAILSHLEAIDAAAAMQVAA